MGNATLEKPIITEADIEGQEILFRMNPKGCLLARPGRLVGSIDYSGQELMIVGYESKEPLFIEAFNQPEVTTHPLTGALVKNPYADLHTITTVKCTHPHLFPESEVEWYDWLPIAKDESKTPQGVEPRQFGKRTNFLLIYGGQSKSAAALFHVPESDTDRWISNFQTTYAVLHHWSMEMAALGAAQGWMATRWGKRVGWTNESNAKGASATELKSVNHLVQGTGADITKRAIKRINAWANKNAIPFEVISTVHDSIVFEMDGECKLDIDNSEFTVNEDDRIVCVKPAWKILTPESQEWLDHAMQIMIDVETEAFDGVLTGRAEASPLAPYWSK